MSSDMGTSKAAAVRQVFGIYAFSIGAALWIGGLIWGCFEHSDGMAILGVAMMIAGYVLMLGLARRKP